MASSSLGKDLQERDLKFETDIRNEHVFGRIVKFTVEQINSFIPERKEIGKGCWGTVYEGTIRGLSGGGSRFNDQRVAVKVGRHLADESDSSNDKYIQWKAEIMILASIKHDAVIKLIGVCRTNLALYLVYPLYERGDLQKNIPNLDWAKAMNIILKIAEGLELLHEQHLLCRGLKPADILLNDNWDPVFTDFGRMILVGDWPLPQSFVFKDEGMIYEDQNYDVWAYDHYSIGIMILQVLMKEQEAKFEVTVTKKRPLNPAAHIHSCRYSSEIKERAKNLKDQNSHAVHPDYFGTGCKGNIAREMTDLALECVHKAGVMRPTASELVNKLKTIVHPQP